MHGDQIYSFHKPKHIHQGPNSLLWGDVKNWSSSWDAWTLPTHLHLYKFLRLHWPFPEGQFPKVETNHAELQHHHLKTPPCRGLERAVQQNQSARRFWGNRWRKQKYKNFGQPQRLDYDTLVHRREKLMLKLATKTMKKFLLPFHMHWIIKLLFLFSEKIA